jgi:hypothetical protein
METRARPETTPRAEWGCDMQTVAPSRRTVLLGSLAALLGGCATAGLTPQEVAEVERLGAFEHVPGRPGIVVGVPHGTPDVGTLEAGRIIRERLGAGGVFVTGFWDGKTRQRINVNRDTEQLIGQHSEVLRQWWTPRAAHVNARYHALVKEAAQGPLRLFFEIHSNHNPKFEGSIEASTLGVSRAEAERLKTAFLAARERLDPAIPRLEIHVAPVDTVTYSFQHASSISDVAAKGCLFEHPGRVFERQPWRRAYAARLAEALVAAAWDR